MRPAHYLSILGAVALLAILWFGGNTVPPAKKPEGGKDAPHQAAGPMMEGAQEGGGPAFPGPTIPPAPTDSILNAARAAAKSPLRDSIALLEQGIAGLRDSATMAPRFDHLAELWEQARQPYAAAWAHGKSGHLSRSVKKLTFAAQFYRQAAAFQASPGVQLWAAMGAVAAFDEAGSLEPSNDTLKLALAESYIEGTGETMKGVGILREITARKPDDVAANLMLGKLSIQSGQIDKAVARLETVLRVQPQNREGLYLMAEAYRAKGDKANAVATLQRLKSIVNEAAFNRDIDQYIQEIQSQ